VFLCFTDLTVPASLYASASAGVYLEDGDRPAVKYRTNAVTVADFLNEAGVFLNEKDEVNVPLTDRIKDEMKITVTRGFPLQILLDGSPHLIWVKENAAIGAVLMELKAKTGVTYLYDGLPNATVFKNSKFELVSERYEITNEIFLIPFEVYVYDIADLAEGEETIANQGDAGLRQIVYSTRYVGGRAVSKEILSVSTLSEPMAHIVFRGGGTQKIADGAEEAAPKADVKPANERVLEIDGETVEYIKDFEMTATAYTAASTGRSASSAYYGITATGIKAERGVVAVDPTVIPMGARLYIEGYGYAVAADTGPSIKGNKVDLYYETLAEAKQYGRQSVMVYLLQIP